MENLILIVILAIFAIMILTAAIKIVREYERAVVFRLGRYVGVRGPGLVFLIPFIENMVKVDLRVVTMDVPAQECITQDTVTVKVDAVVYFRVVKPQDAILNVEQYVRATSLLAQTTLRNVVGQSELEELLSHRDKVMKNFRNSSMKELKAGVSK
jgi:regulator of protease activity HflC (stomatin/prohibitin superfamily)